MSGECACKMRGTTGFFDLFYNLLFGPSQLRWRTHKNVVLCPVNLDVDPERFWESFQRNLKLTVWF